MLIFTDRYMRKPHEGWDLRLMPAWLWRQSGDNFSREKEPVNVCLSASGWEGGLLEEVRTLYVQVGRQGLRG